MDISHMPRQWVPKFPKFSTSIFFWSNIMPHDIVVAVDLGALLNAAASIGFNGQLVLTEKSYARQSQTISSSTHCFRCVGSLLGCQDNAHVDAPQWFLERRCWPYAITRQSNPDTKQFGRRAAHEIAIWFIIFVNFVILASFGLGHMISFVTYVNKKCWLITCHITISNPWTGRGMDQILYILYFLYISMDWPVKQVGTCGIKMLCLCKTIVRHVKKSLHVIFPYQIPGLAGKMVNFYIFYGLSSGKSCFVCEKNVTFANKMLHI